MPDTPERGARLFTPAEVAEMLQLSVDEVIALVGLTDKRDARPKTLSGGQRRRLDLALGLVGDPDLLFLDEPTPGFDPSARRRAWELVASLRREPHEPDATCWMHGEGFCLSTRPPAA